MEQFFSQKITKVAYVIVAFLVVATFKRIVKADNNNVNVPNSVVGDAVVDGAVGGFQLLLMPKAESSDSDAIICRVILRNKSDKNLYYPESYPLSDYKFTVKNEKGKIVPLTLFGQNNRVPSFFRYVQSLLSPGKSTSFEFPINRIYDMSQSGFYTVSVSRAILQKEGERYQKTVITSNTIKIKRNTAVINNVTAESKISENESKIRAIPPSDDWQVGDRWKLNVDIFTPAIPLSPKKSTIDYLNLEQKIAEGKTRTLYSYTMTVKVADITKVDGKEQVKLVFIPDDKAIYFVKDKRPEITIDRATHQLVKVDVPGHPNNYTSLLNGQPVIVHSVDGYQAGFPVDIIPQIAPASTAQLSAKYSDMHLDVNRSSAKGVQTIQEKLTVEGKDWFRVTQVWPAGAKWWSEYLKEDFEAQIGMRVRLAGEAQIKWGPIINGLQLGISSDDTSTDGGDPVRVHVALRNTLDKPLPVPSLFLGQNLQVKFVRDKEDVTPLTALGKTVQAASLSVLPSKMIPPHSVLSGDISLGNIYDLSRAGIYTISASATSSSPSSPRLESPPLMIQVKNNDISESAEE